MLVERLFARMTGGEQDASCGGTDHRPSVRRHRANASPGFLGELHFAGQQALGGGVEFGDLLPVHFAVEAVVFERRAKHSVVASLGQIEIAGSEIGPEPACKTDFSNHAFAGANVL